MYKFPPMFSLFVALNFPKWSNYCKEVTEQVLFDSIRFNDKYNETKPQNLYPTNRGYCGDNFPIKVEWGVGKISLSQEGKTNWNQMHENVLQSSKPV